MAENSAAAFKFSNNSHDPFLWNKNLQPGLFCSSYSNQILSEKLAIAADDKSFQRSLRLGFRWTAISIIATRKRERLTSGLFMRRARFGIEGNFHLYEYAVSFDFASNQNELGRRLSSSQIWAWKLTIGQFKVFESLEQMADSNDLALMERSYVSETAAGFKMGAAYNGITEKCGYSANIYNNTEAVTAGGKPVD